MKKEMYYTNSDLINKKAFTLAEVLITLLIIGVVSSLVIPTLINDTQDAELNTALKKTYAELSVASKQIIYDNGGTFKGILASDSDHSGLRNTYAEHLNYTKSCNDARTQGCWHSLSTNGGTWRGLNGSQTDTYNADSGLILNNGALVNFVVFSKDCSGTVASYSKPTVCAWIIADVNGLKMPNRIGKDVFYFHLLANRLEPLGAPDCTSHNCNGDGVYCATTKLTQ